MTTAPVDRRLGRGDEGPDAEGTRATPEQQAIIEWEDGPLVVIAGAGTGKTRVIVERVRRLLDTKGEAAWVAAGNGSTPAGTPGRHEPPFDGPLLPEQILVLTYNVKAAKELGDRLEQALGPATRARVAVSNFHSFCHRLLTENQAEAGLAARADVLDGVGQVLLLRDIWPDLPLLYHSSRGGDAGWWLGQIVAFINRAKDELVTPAAMAAFGEGEAAVFEREHGPLRPAIERLRTLGNLTPARKVRGAQARYRAAVRAYERSDDPFAIAPSDERVTKTAESEARRTVDGAGHARALSRFTPEEREEIEELAATYVVDGAALEVLRLRELALVYHAYQDELHRRGALDFGEQIAAVIRLFRERPNVLRRYQRQFRYILVDEFQDANVAQIELVELLGRTPDRPDNVMVVGDDDQSIYRFRGASYAAFAEFDRRFSAPPRHAPEAPSPGPPTRLRLEENHRSGGHVLTAANRLIARNQMRFEPDKRLWTRRGNGLPVELVSCASPQDEAVAIADRIRELTGRTDPAAGPARLDPAAGAGPRPWSDIAILYRKHRHREAIVARLRDEDIPYTVVGGLSLFETPEIRDLEQTLRAIADPLQDVALGRMLSAGPWRLDALEILAVTRMAKYDRRHLVEAIREIVESGEVVVGREAETASASAGAEAGEEGNGRPEGAIPLQPRTLDLLAESAGLAELEAGADEVGADEVGPDEVGADEVGADEDTPGRQSRHGMIQSRVGITGAGPAPDGGGEREPTPGDSESGGGESAPAGRQHRDDRQRRPIEPATRSKLRRVLETLDTFAPLTWREGPHAILERLLERTGTVLDLIAADTRESQRQAANVASFLRFAFDWQQEHPQGSLAGFVDYLDAYQAAGGELPTSVELTEDVDGVRLMTLYQAKGLEFPCVFVPYLLDGEWPVGRDTAEALPRELLREPVPPGDLLIEEERRLLYVAMTRTEERLVLTTHEGPGVEKAVSLFVSELREKAGPELVEAPSDARMAELAAETGTAEATGEPDDFEMDGLEPPEGFEFEPWEPPAPVVPAPAGAPSAPATSAETALRRVMPLPTAREHRLALRLRASELLGLIEAADPVDPETPGARAAFAAELAVVGESAALTADQARAAGLDPLTMRTVALDSGSGANLLAVAALPDAFSYSQFDAYERCPLQYAFKHVYRFPEAEGRAALTFGSTAHAAFERFTRERRERVARGDPPPTFEDLRRFFDEEWEPGAYGTKAAEDGYRARTVPLLDAFWRGELEGERREVVAEELKFELVLEPADGSPAVLVIGSIDRIDRLPSGGIEVVDYKTGRVTSQKGVDESLQLSIYALACRDELGLGTPERVTLYFTEAETRLTTSRTDEQLDAARADILERAARIRSGDFAATPSAKACGYCDFRAMCPARWVG